MNATRRAVHGPVASALAVPVGGQDDQALIDSVERGEDLVRARVEKILDDGDLPEGAEQVIAQAYTLIKADHDALRRLKRQFH